MPYQLLQKYQTRLLSTVQDLEKILAENAKHDDKDYSVYTGTSGQAYLQLQLHLKLPGVRNDHYLQKALTWLKPCLQRLKGSRSSFLCGDAGPLALAAIIYDKLGDKKHCQTYISRLESMCGSVCQDQTIPDEILYGRCGYISALLFLQKHLGEDAVSHDCIIEVAEAVLRSGESLAKAKHCSHPLMYEWHEKAYLGAAHGLAGIYCILLQVKEPSIQERIQRTVKPCVDLMLSLRFASGNCPSSINSDSGDKLVHWCHGAPGWVHLFVIAYKIYGDKRYLEAAKDCAKVVWQRGLLYKGYGLCHGTAGNAYTFLTLFKLTGEQRYLYYAVKFAEWCSDFGKHGCRTPDRPFSMFEGLAGTAYFLVDMMDPLNANFPGFEYNV